MKIVINYDSESRWCSKLFRAACLVAQQYHHIKAKRTIKFNT